MIVWNAGRRFFALKSEATAHARALGRRIVVHKLELTNRDELATFLSAICDAPPPAPVPDQAIIEAAAVPPDTDVPAFIRESWEKLRDSWKNA